MVLTPATASAAPPPPQPPPADDSGEAQPVDVFGGALAACGVVNYGCAAAAGGYTAFKGAYDNSFTYKPK